MMKTNGKRHGLRAYRILLWGMILIMLFSVSAFAAFASPSAHVIDKAGLFKAEEKAKLEQEIAETGKKISMDIVVMTTKSTEGKDSKLYAADFFRESGYGYGSGKSGFVFLVDMEHRKLQMITKGGAITLFTDERIDSITDDAAEYAKGGDYLKASETVLSRAEKYYADAAKQGYSYDADTGTFTKAPKKKAMTPLKAIVAALASFAAAISSVLGVKRQYAMKGAMNASMQSSFAYRAAAAFAFAAVTDDLINQQTTQRIIPRQKNNGGSGDGPFGHSSTFSDSGGSSYGGGHGSSF